MRCGKSAAGLESDPRSPPDGPYAAAGVVHDLGNLIQIAASAVNIIGRSPWAARETALEPIVARARTALERAAALVRQTTGRTVGSAFELRATPGLQSLPCCLGEIQALISWICDPDIVLSTEAATDLPLLRCNRIELQSAVLNLVINAREAMPDGGSIRIVARCVADGPFVGVVELSVVDDGVGMSRETLMRAFNPYFTTKVGGRGGGLGLAMVKRFAEEAGGRVDIASALGAGTAVTLRLPSVFRPDMDRAEDCDGLARPAPEAAAR
jgi:signal transduction histidine kinase